MDGGWCKSDGRLVRVSVRLLWGGLQGLVFLVREEKRWVGSVKLLIETIGFENGFFDSTARGWFWGKGRVMVEMMAEQGRGFLWCCFFCCWLKERVKTMVWGLGWTSSSQPASIASLCYL